MNWWRSRTVTSWPPEDDSFAEHSHQQTTANSDDSDNNQITYTEEMESTKADKRPSNEDIEQEADDATKTLETFQVKVF